MKYSILSASLPLLIVYTSLVASRVEAQTGSTGTISKSVSISTTASPTEEGIAPQVPTSDPSWIEHYETLKLVQFPYSALMVGGFCAKVRIGSEIDWYCAGVAPKNNGYSGPFLRPLRIAGLPPTSQISNIVRARLSSGVSGFCAEAVNGSVYCWGSPRYFPRVTLPTENGLFSRAFKVTLPGRILAGSLVGGSSFCAVIDERATCFGPELPAWFRAEEISAPAPSFSRFQEYNSWSPNPTTEAGIDFDNYRYARNPTGFWFPPFEGHVTSIKTTEGSAAICATTVDNEIQCIGAHDFGINGINPTPTVSGSSYYRSVTWGAGHGSLTPIKVFQGTPAITGLSTVYNASRNPSFCLSSSKIGQLACWGAGFLATKPPFQNFLPLRLSGYNYDYFPGLTRMNLDSGGIRFLQDSFYPCSASDSQISCLGQKGIFDFAMSRYSTRPISFPRETNELIVSRYKGIEPEGAFIGAYSVFAINALTKRLMVSGSPDIFDGGGYENFNRFFGYAPEPGQILRLSFPVDRYLVRPISIKLAAPQTGPFTVGR